MIPSCIEKDLDAAELASFVQAPRKRSGDGVAVYSWRIAYVYNPLVKGVRSWKVRGREAYVSAETLYLALTAFDRLRPCNSRVVSVSLVGRKGGAA